MTKQLLVSLPTVPAVYRRNILKTLIAFLFQTILLTAAPPSPAFASAWSIQTIEYWGDNGLENSIALDSLGQVHVSYLEFDYLARVYYLKYAFWDGSDWQIQYVAYAGDLPDNTSLALDSNDRPRICYTYSQLGGRPILGHAKWNGSTWDLWGIDYGASCSLSLDTNNSSHISYSNPYSVVINEVVVPRSDLKYTHGTDQSWQIQTVEYGGRIGEESSLALDSQLRPHIAYRDFGLVSGLLKYAVWNGLAWEIHVVDTEGDAGKNPSLALDSDDRPHVSYAGGDYGLRYGTYDGTSWQTETVDAGVAHYSLPNSIALDHRDRPHISYQDNGLSILKYAAWDGLAWQIDIVDQSNSPGLYNSLVLDGENQPHICYYETTYGDLKYATTDVAITLADISVLGGGAQISDGDTSPSVADQTDFGVAAVSNCSVTHTFSIANNGTAALNLTGTPYVNIVGAHAVDFEVTLQPTSPVGTGDTTVFEVRFDPSEEGLREATVSIASDDSDENPYDFAIQGEGAAIDTDGDGIPDVIDPDDDNDGAPDARDAFPLDPTESVDTDRDGIGNNADPDDDNDGVLDNLDPDDDNDGIADVQDPYPADPLMPMGALPSRGGWRGTVP